MWAIRGENHRPHGDGERAYHHSGWDKFYPLLHVAKASPMVLFVSPGFAALLMPIVGF
jgi:hypothetical protein